MKRETKPSPTPAVVRNVAMTELPHALVRPRAVANSGRLTAHSGPLTAPTPAHPSAQDPEPSVDAHALHAAQEQRVRDAVAQALKQAGAAAFEQARREGLRQGLQEAEQAAAQLLAQRQTQDQAELQGELDHLKRLIAQAGKEVGHIIEAAQDELIAIAFEAVCRILGQQGVSTASVQSMVRHVMQDYTGSLALCAHLHPEDVQHLQNLSDHGGTPDHVRWIADPHIALGGLVLRSGAGEIDARLETVLEGFKNTLLAVRRQQRHARARDAATAASAPEPGAAR